RAAREEHVLVPEELSITGFDNTLISKSSDAPLTTVEVPVQSMCSQAVDLLIDEIEGKASEKQKILVLPKLIVRKSTSRFH
ncbi:substrate-binding domain-containing protein, partial [Bacillus inaquosorum]|uniref:substrate-binding domain-containing protein n=1 Tax=Bacillus inaquosorum TaxID=483913 RepID=UPI0022802CC1